MSALCTRLARLGALAITWTSAVTASVIDTSAQAPYESCAYCHGYDGNAPGDRFPAIAGQPKGYLVKQLRDYRAGRRWGGGEMQPAARLLSEADVLVVADYFSKQPLRADDPDQRRPSGTLGARLFNRGRKGQIACIACHVRSDQSAPFDYPRILGQNAAYLRTQLEAYRRGERTNDPLGVMRQIAQSLSQDEINAVATYAAEGS